jgi:hypothetical protein
MILAIALIVTAAVGWWLIARFGNREDPRSLQHLSKVAAEMNQSVPAMIDAETELLPITAEPSLLIYNYRLVNYSAAQIDPEKFREGARQRVMEGACSRPETRDEFLQYGVTLRYSYFDKDKKPIAAVDVTPKDCGFQ